MQERVVLAGELFERRVWAAGRVGAEDAGLQGAAAGEARGVLVRRDLGRVDEGELVDVADVDGDAGVCVDGNEATDRDFRTLSKWENGPCGDREVEGRLPQSSGVHGVHGGPALACAGGEGERRARPSKDGTRV